MYRKYPSDLFRQGDRIYQQQLHPHSEMTVPYRPLPPVPTETRGENGFKTQESNVSSVNKKDTSNTKVKKRFFFGKWHHSGIEVDSMVSHAALEVWSLHLLKNMKYIPHNLLCSCTNAKL